MLDDNTLVHGAGFSIILAQLFCAFRKIQVCRVSLSRVSVQCYCNCQLSNCIYISFYFIYIMFYIYI